MTTTQAALQAYRAARLDYNEAWNHWNGARGAYRAASRGDSQREERAFLAARRALKDAEAKFDAAEAALNATGHTGEAW